jgi:hypothetical protein
VTSVAGNRRRVRRRPEFSKLDATRAFVSRQQQGQNQEAREREERRHAQEAAAHPLEFGVKAQDRQHTQRAQAVDGRIVTPLVHRVAPDLSSDRLLHAGADSRRRIRLDSNAEPGAGAGRLPPCPGGADPRVDVSC